MKLSQLISEIKTLHIYGDIDREICDIEDDTRKINKDFAFIALRGYTVDGHDFVGKAVENGATVVFCEEYREEYNQYNATFIIVDDTGLSMADIAKIFYDDPSKKLKIIGITGTNGKTSTTYYLREIFNFAGKKSGIIGTNGIWILDEFFETKNTTPNSLALTKIFSQMVDNGVEYVAMEVSSHALALGRVKGVTFYGAVFTNLTKDHLDYHKTMEEYFQAKRLLFTYDLKFKLINADDEYGKRLLDEFKDANGYGVASECDFKATNVVEEFRKVSYELVREGNDNIHIEARTPGMFSVYNTMSAACTGLLLGIEAKTIEKAISDKSPIRGRFEIVDTDTEYSVVIDYAHTPDGLLKVIETINNIPDKARTIVLFGAGGDRDKTKRPEMAKIVGELADFAIVTSDNPRFEDPIRIIKDILPGFEGTDIKYAVIVDRREAIYFALDMAGKNDIILLAGKGHETYILKQGEVLHFDEREIVQEYLNR